MPLKFDTTNVFARNMDAWLGGKRRALNEGGTSSSKTFSVIQLLTLTLRHSKAPMIASVVSESLPHLKRGCVRDFAAIMGDSFDGAAWSKTEHIYTFPNGSKLEFFPADEPSKLRGGRRDILFINEANNVSYPAFKELDIRTRAFTYLDWNPVGEFWAHEHLMGKPENEYVHSIYLDARHVLPPEVVTNIESNRDTDPNWWNVYGLGRLGKVSGLVYPAPFDQLDALPASPNEFYGLDFGFSNDVTALVRCRIVTGPDPEAGKKRVDMLACEELIYEAGLTNPAICHRMDELGMRRHHDEIFADAAEPKSIEEIHRYGYNVKACPKGADSVEFGHQRVRQYRLAWTKASLNCIKEQRNFRYIEDKNGALTDKTTHTWSHGMDARRYGLVGKLADGGPQIWL